MLSIRGDVVTSSRRSQRPPRLIPRWLLKVVFYSTNSTDSTLHLGTAYSADIALHLGTAESADSTLHLGIAYRVDSHDTVFTVTILLTVLTVSILLHYKHCQQPLGGPSTLETPFDPIPRLSLFYIYFFLCRTLSLSETTLATMCHLVRPPFPQRRWESETHSLQGEQAVAVRWWTLPNILSNRRPEVPI